MSSYTEAKDAYDHAFNSLVGYERLLLSYHTHLVPAINEFYPDVNPLNIIGPIGKNALIQIYDLWAKDGVMWKLLNFEFYDKVPTNLAKLEVARRLIREPLNNLDVTNQHFALLSSVLCETDEVLDEVRKKIQWLKVTI